ncbi:MAG: hypothetical protein ACHQ4G_12490 [Opitutales bacterium]
MNEPVPSSPPSLSRLSKTPSWVTLGFVLGALFVWALPRVETTVAPPPAGKSFSVQLERPRATEIEAVFAEWGRFAVWENDLTEVALWDVDKRSYSICYEVLRSGENLYFRSIPRLTRPVLTHGIHVATPLQFTETEAMRREWLDRGQSELPARAATPGDGKS